MLVAIDSPDGHLELVLKQVYALQGILFVTGGLDVNAAVTILDEKSDYIIHAGDKEVLVNKPAKIEELSRAVLIGLNDRRYKLKEAIFYPWRRCVIAGESTLTLTEKESEVLHHLLSVAPSPIHKKDLLKEIWGYSEESETSTVEAHIYRLRGKLASLGLGDVIITGENSYGVMV